MLENTEELFEYENDYLSELIEDDIFEEENNPISEDYVSEILNEEDKNFISKINMDFNDFINSIQK